MINIIIFSIISLIIFTLTFLVMLKKNNFNYISCLIFEFLGIIINFTYILNSKVPNDFIIIIMYICSIIVPIIYWYLEKNDIDIFEKIKILKSRYYENKNQKEKAKQILINNIEKNPNSYLTHKALAEWYERNSEKEKAEYEYIKCIDIKPNNLENVLKLAKIYKENNKSEEAIKIIVQTLKNKPEYLEMSLLLGDILYEKERFKEAINVYQEALRYNPDKYEIYYCMGMTYTRLNDFQNAKAYYQKAAKLNSFLNVAKLNLGQISLIFKELDEAKEYFMQCIEIEDEKVQAQAYYYLAKINIMNGQIELGIQYANIALEINPKILKLMENDIYFGIIIGKLNLKEDKNIVTKLDKKEEQSIIYLNNTYDVVDKLTQEKRKDNLKDIEKEREI